MDNKDLKILTELKRNFGDFFVPYSDYIKDNKPIWYVGFSIFEIEIIDDNHLHFGYDAESSSGWEDIYVDFIIKNNKFIIKGKGSRLFRENIINAYNWFIKAKNDKSYIDCFHPIWFEK